MATLSYRKEKIPGRGAVALSTGTKRGVVGFAAPDPVFPVSERIGQSLLNVVSHPPTRPQREENLPDSHCLVRATLFTCGERRCFVQAE